MVVGIVAALGSDLDCFKELIDGYLKNSFGYDTNHIRISDLLHEIVEELAISVHMSRADEATRIESAMDAGDAIRRYFTRADILALHAAARILSGRRRDDTKVPLPYQRTIHLIRSLKRPEEVDTLRRIYGPGFFLIGVHASQASRLSFLTDRKHIDPKAAVRLIQRDEKGSEAFGQRARDTFSMADAFIDITEQADPKAQDSAIKRFLNLLFGHPFTTPTPDEYGMFLAYSASLRSASPSRQVGAAILSETKEVLALGCNDVPAPLGGLYWPGEGDQRDHIRVQDPNDERKLEIAVDLVQRTSPQLSPAEAKARAKTALAGSLLDEITEFGRAVHAEMEALLSCARQGLSPRGATLYTTTFPCHNCAKHIAAAGIGRVVYIEPYEKSRALLLHQDAFVRIDAGDPSQTSDGKVALTHFVGLGPRRYFDLFSTRLGSGEPVVRKSHLTGELATWHPESASTRVRLQPRSYLEREMIASRELEAAMQQARANPVDGAEEDGA